MQKQKRLADLKTGLSSTQLLSIKGGDGGTTPPPPPPSVIIDDTTSF